MTSRETVPLHGSYVYLARSEDGRYAKIGRSNDPVSRIQSLQTGSPLRLVLLVWFPGDERDEQSLHARFEQHRVLGEWFHYKPAISDFVRWLVRENPPPTPAQELYDKYLDDRELDAWAGALLYECHEVGC